MDLAQLQGEHRRLSAEMEKLAELGKVAAFLCARACARAGLCARGRACACAGRRVCAQACASDPAHQGISPSGPARRPPSHPNHANQNRFFDSALVQQRIGDLAESLSQRRIG